MSNSTRGVSNNTLPVRNSCRIDSPGGAATAPLEPARIRSSSPSLHSCDCPLAGAAVGRSRCAVALPAAPDAPSPPAPLRTDAVAVTGTPPPPAASASHSCHTHRVLVVLMVLNYSQYFYRSCHRHGVLVVLMIFPSGISNSYDCGYV